MVENKMRHAKFEVLLNTAIFHYFVSETKHWKDCFKSSNNKLEKTFKNFDTRLLISSQVSKADGYVGFSSIHSIPSKIKRSFSNIAKVHVDKMGFRNEVGTSATYRISLRPCVFYV